MRGRKHWAGVVILLLGVTPMWAQAQRTDTASISIGSGLPFEQYSASLSITTSPGAWRRAPRAARLQHRVAKTRDRETPSAPQSAVSAMPPAVTTCPMPIALVDTAGDRRMPVVRVAPSAPVAGTLRGCENPLGPAR